MKNFAKYSSILLFSAFLLMACEGKDGPAGATGPKGELGVAGPAGANGEAIDYSDYAAVKASYGLKD